MPMSARRLVFIVGLLCLPTNEAHAQSDAVPVAAPDATALAVVRAYIAAYNAHDVDGVIRLLSADFTWLSLSGDSLSVEVRGASAVRSSLIRYFQDFPSAMSEIDGATALGPWVTLRERARWQDTAGPRSQAAISVYEVCAGLLRRVWYYPAVKD